MPGTNYRIEIKWEVDHYHAPRSVVVTKKNDSIQFINCTQDKPSKLLVQLSEEDLFHPKPSQSDLTLAKPGASSDPLKISKSSRRGVHTYAVFCETTGEFATAGSMPIIIVDPLD